MKDGYFVAGDRIGTSLESAAEKRKIVVFAPEGVNPRELEEIVSSLQREGIVVLPYRDDIRLHSERVEKGCKGATDFVLLIEDESSPREQQVVRVARAAKIEKFALICLGSCDALARHRQLAKSGRIRLVVIQSQMEHHRVPQILGVRVSNVLIAHNLVQFAREIGRTVVGP